MAESEGGEIMCEHVFEFHEYGESCVKICCLCKKTPRQTELEQQLSSANARVAELEKEINNYLSFGQGGASFSDSQ